MKRTDDMTQYTNSFFTTTEALVHMQRKRDMFARDNRKEKCSQQYFLSPCVSFCQIILFRFMCIHKVFCSFFFVILLALVSFVRLSAGELNSWRHVDDFTHSIDMKATKNDSHTSECVCVDARNSTRHRGVASIDDDNEKKKYDIQILTHRIKSNDKNHMKLFSICHFICFCWDESGALVQHTFAKNHFAHFRCALSCFAHSYFLSIPIFRLKLSRLPFALNFSCVESHFFRFKLRQNWFNEVSIL